MTLLDDLNIVWNSNSIPGCAAAAYHRLRAALSKLECPHGKPREPHGPACGCDCCFLSKQVTELRLRLEAVAEVGQSQNVELELRIAEMRESLSDVFSSTGEQYMAFNNRICNFEARLAALEKNK